MEYAFGYRGEIKCLVCTMTNESINSYVYNMTTGNDIRGVINPIYEVDEYGRKKLVYNLKNKCLFKDYVKYYGGMEEKREIVEGIEHLWEELECYMLDDTFFIWDFNYLYVDCITGEPYVICLAANTPTSGHLDRERYICNLEKFFRAEETINSTYCENAEVVSAEQKKSYSIKKMKKQDGKSEKKYCALEDKKTAGEKAKVVKVVKLKKETPGYVIPS